MADDFGLDLGFGGGGLGIPRKRRRKIDEFSQEDEDTILGTLGNKALGGVAAIGNVLDLPGSSVRDLIAGENPFDQYLTPISPENRTTGRDLLRQSGMISGEDTTGNWWGGLAAEIALDPTTYLSGGLTAGGKAFRAAGVLDDAVKVGMKAGKRIGPRLGRMTTSFKEGFDLLDDAGKAAVQEYATKAGLDLASVADEPIQSLGRVSLPFTDIGFNFGSGKLSQGVAGGLDWAGDVLKQAGPVRAARALFDPSVNGKLGYAEQQIAEQAYKAKWKSERAAKAAHVKLLGEMDEGFKAFNETMGPEIAARNQAAWDGFKTKLGTAGNLNAEQTEAISQVWKGYAEGYLKMDPGEAVQKLISDIQPGGALDPKALKQGIGTVPHGWTDDMADRFDRLESMAEEGTATPPQLEELARMRDVWEGKQRWNGVSWKSDSDNVLRGVTLNGKTASIGKAGDKYMVELADPSANYFGSVSRGFDTLDEAKRFVAADTAGLSIHAVSQSLVDASGAIRSDPSVVYSVGKKGYGHRRLDFPDKASGERALDGMIARQLPPSAKPSKNADLAFNILHDAQYRPMSGDGEALSIADAQAELAKFSWKMSPDVLNELKSGALSVEEAMALAQRSNEEWDMLLKSDPTPADAMFRALKDEFQDEMRGLENFTESTRQKLDVNLNLHPEIIDDVADEFMRLKKEATGIGPRAIDEELYDLTKRVDDAVDGIDSTDEFTQQLASKIQSAKLGRVQEVLKRIPNVSPKGLVKQLGDITESQAEQLLKMAKEDTLKQVGDSTTKGAVTFKEDGKALIQFFGAADVSTHLHEASHVMRRHLTDADNEIANAFVGAGKGAKWTVDQEEKWARGFENFMTTGKAPSAIKAVFNRLKEWMVGIYSSIKGSAVDVKLTPEIKELYGRLIGSSPAPKVGNSIAYETYDKLIRLSAETGDNVEEAWKLLSDGAQDLPDNVKAQVKELGANIRKMNKDAHDEFLSMGGKSGTITDRLADDATGTVGFSHMARSVDHRPQDMADLRAGRTLKTSFDNAKGRDAVTRMVPTEVANRLAKDQVIRDAIAADRAAKAAADAARTAGTAIPTTATDTAARLIESKYGQFLDPAHKIDDVAVGKTGHADELVDWVGEQRQRDKYTKMTVEDFLKYQTGVQAAIRNMHAMHEIVGREMVTAAEVQAKLGGNAVSVERAFKNAGLSDAAIEHWAKQSGYAFHEAADSFFVPADVANALVSVNKIYDQPEWAKAIGETIDNFHGWWKNAMTVPFPSFHSRNFSSAQYMNLVASGLVETPSDLAMYGGEFQQALKMLTSTGVPREMQEELYISGVLGKYTRSEDVGINAINANQLPGQPPSLSINPLNALEQYKQTSAKMEASYLDAVPGGRFARTALSSVSDAGSRVAENVEFLNRVPLYNYLRKKGWSAEAAAQKVDDLHVNYADLAPFEKNVMRRLVPFYAFQRRIAPVLMTTLLERPGGGLAQTIKASADLSNADPLTPEHVSSTLAIPNPLKGDDFAGKSYFTGLGLPHEQLGQFFGGPQTILREAASQMSPIVKGPLEWATGQSFFQAGPGGKGRDLEDLDPTIGRTLGNIAGTDKWGTPTALEHIAANLPTSRIAGTLRQLTDTRKSNVEKGINLLTGVKVSDVSESNQERVIQQRALDLMDEMGARTFAKPYFPEGIEEAMTPEEQKQAQALELLQAVLADRQKRRKAKKKEK